VDLPVGTVVDRYIVEATLGEGGMAVVYRVRHKLLGSSHAMKVLAVPMPSVSDRLMQEGRVQSSIQHPNIVPVTDVVEVGDMPALVMEYVRGPSLDEYLRETRPTLEQIDDLAHGILRGVAAAHRHGLIHRDLKPSNILIAVTDEGLIPKITDFGLVKVLAGDTDSSGSSMSRTRSGMRMGTPPYMAPEQIRDTKGVDERADIFSLGAVLYELVTGRRCFGGIDVMEVFMAVCAGEYVDPREINPETPERIVAAIAGALKVDHASRTPTCEALLKNWTGRGGVSSWDEASLQKAEALGSGSRRMVSFVPAEPDETFVLPEVAIPMEHVAAGTFDMGLRQVTLTGAYEISRAPVTQETWQSIMHANPSAFTDNGRPVEQVSWHDALEFCNRASVSVGVDPAYAFGSFKPRKGYSLDDMGRMLYDLIPFARIPHVLKHFGTETLHVLQFEPTRLSEVAGIGSKTAARIAGSWDPYKYYERDVKWVDGAAGFRLPTEAEWARSATGSEVWEWVWDADPGPKFAVDPVTLPEEPAVDPLGEEGPRRIVRRRGDRRGCREPRMREADLGFRVARGI